ncbi:SnoaL-like domain-containing protein [Amycolatopsis marina]|uniref:SnoaL-like domain-containing protein n=1 Tax=Amycolatopsis marina TaxID=490629 RepID=A0A1I1AZH9_9PSEU|nr:nuclear transport factor 2 family protein [Amycolatopsis marina]SFB43509.1 SnoaL-like domain-containing protein [Amycolatopsis marina]
MSVVTDWPALHEHVIERFAAGWSDPHPHAWDDLLAEDVELTQPLLRHGRGRALWHEEALRLLAFLPDLRGEVLSWAARKDIVFIDLRLSGTAGGARLSVRACDQLTITTSGRIARRDSRFDPRPVMGTLMRHPSTWWPWWRSGIGPLTARRALLTSRPGAVADRRSQELR